MDTQIPICREEFRLGISRVEAFNTKNKRVKEFPPSLLEDPRRVHVFVQVSIAAEHAHARTSSENSGHRGGWKRSMLSIPFPSRNRPTRQSREEKATNGTIASSNATDLFFNPEGRTRSTRKGKLARCIVSNRFESENEKLFPTLSRSQLDLAIRIGSARRV